MGAGAPDATATVIRLSLSENTTPLEELLRTQPSGYWTENPGPWYVSHTTLSGMSPAAATVPEGSALEDGVTTPVGWWLDPQAATTPISASGASRRSKET